MLKTGKLLLVVLAVVMTVSACRKKPKTAPVPAETTTAAQRERNRIDSIAAVEEARAAADRAREENMRAQQQTSRSAQTTIAASIYFELDDANLTPEAIGVLEAKVIAMRGETGMRIRITGHTDNRGSDEYNVALGMRRAAETKRFLIDRGIAGSRIDIATRGEEEPAATGEDETAWSRNRRAEFAIISR
ncbi:MAG: OmpA family protein [Gemmatimonadaceae bacterium]|nr:OmpA family protein [Gemmatimonadaceae bacterium]